MVVVIIQYVIAERTNEIRTYPAILKSKAKLMIENSFFACINLVICEILLTSPGVSCRCISERDILASNSTLLFYRSGSCAVVICNSNM